MSPDAVRPERRRLPRLWTDRPYGEGVYRRALELVNDPAGGRTYGELEDDLHHFRVVIVHDGNTIQRADGEALRWPWESCASADEPLRAIEGQPLTSQSTGIGAYTDARRNCTHLFDLAGLAVAHARRPAPRRRYDIEVTDRSGPNRRFHASIRRDGEQVIEWHLEEEAIVAPTAWVGVDLRTRFIPRAESSLDPDQAEAAIALRRALSIAGGRSMNLDEVVHASDVRMMGFAVCHTYTDGVAQVSLRRKGSAIDFSDHPDAVLPDLDLRP